MSETQKPKKHIGCVIAYRRGHTNYGTSLVGYALLETLRAMGHEVEVIHYVKRPTLADKVRWVVNAVRCGMGASLVGRLRRRRDLRAHPAYAEGIRRRTAAVEAWKERRLQPAFRDYVGYDALRAGSAGYDVVLVGSDQVWLPMGLPTRFFNLLFTVDAVRRVAYASSFGVSQIPAFQREATGRYLDRFYRIGVREEQGKRLVESLSRQRAEVVADPTLLLGPAGWDAEVEGTPLPSGVERGAYVFCYFLGPNAEARAAAQRLAGAKGLPIVALRHMDDYVAADETIGDVAPYDVDPGGFVRLIRDAAYVCTDSFHCSAFSIQYHKAFMTFYRFAQGSTTGRNSRIDSLFATLGIGRERIYAGDVALIDREVDWADVDRRLAGLRERSMAFLREALA